MRQRKAHGAETTMFEEKNAGGFADRFLGITSNPDDAGCMPFGVTPFGLQGTFQITPKIREWAQTKWRDNVRDQRVCDRATNRNTVITLNTPCTPKDMKKIVQMGHKSPDRYDKDFIDSLMTVQTWQQNRADEEECHLPLKFVAFDNAVPAAFACISIYIRDQPQARATYVTCVMDMLVIDAEKSSEGFDVDLSIACAKFLLDVMHQIYGALPEHRSVVTDVLDEMDSKTDCDLAHHVLQAILEAWETSRSDEHITSKGIVLEKPVFDFGNDVGSMEYVEVLDDDFNF